MMRQHTRLIAWVGAVALMVAFSALGHWQWSRMQHKQSLLMQAAAAPGNIVPFEQASQQPARVQAVTVTGTWGPDVVLLDNQLRHGQAGVKVYQPLLPLSGNAALLVDLGWLPMPANRTLPSPPPLQGEIAINGLLASAPAVGLALGPGVTAAGAPRQWLATRLDAGELSAVLELQGRALHGQVLRLDPALPLGFERDLELLPNTLTPERHLGYAVQWYALALAVLVVALVLEWQRARRARRQGSGRKDEHEYP